MRYTKWMAIGVALAALSSTGALASDTPAGRAEAQRGLHSDEAAVMRDLGGKVIKSEANTVYLEHMGAVVPVEISRHTRFSGVRSVNDLVEGQEVRASFTVKDGTRNVADSVSVGAPARATKRAPEPEYQDYGG